MNFRSSKPFSAFPSLLRIKYKFFNRTSIRFFLTSTSSPCLTLFFHLSPLSTSWREETRTCARQPSLPCMGHAVSAFTSAHLSAWNSVLITTCLICFLHFKFIFFPGSLLSLVGWFSSQCVQFYLCRPHYFTELYFCSFPHFFTHTPIISIRAGIYVFTIFVVSSLTLLLVYKSPVTLLNGQIQIPTHKHVRA